MNEIRNLAKQHYGGPVTCARDFLRVEMQASLGESRLSLGHTSATARRCVWRGPVEHILNLGRPLG